MSLSAEDVPGRIWLLVAILGAAGFGRLVGAISAPLIFDEHQWLAIVDRISLMPDRISLPLHGDQHPPGQAYWAALGTALLGPNLLGFRIASVLLGTLLVYLTYRVGHLYFGARAGWPAPLRIVAPITNRAKFTIPSDNTLSAPEPARYSVG